MQQKGLAMQDKMVWRWIVGGPLMTWQTTPTAKYSTESYNNNNTNTW